MNEAETRATYIDTALRDSGWGVVEGSRIRLEYPITQGRLIGNGKREKPRSADYVLQYRNRNVAVIEAKPKDKPYTEGVGQAKDYAGKLLVRFTYSTNGLKIYQIDMQTGEEKDVEKYPSPEELWNLVSGENAALQTLTQNWIDKLSSIPFETKSGWWQLRYYQENAINSVIDAIASGEKRILLTLATGTGKTAIAFQIAWKLFHTRWNLQLDGQRMPRILFLADRNILANQAYNSFSAFEEDALVRIRPSEIKKKGRVPTNGSIFFTIFQTFMSGENKSPYFGDYPKDFFDFIIIDECHRGGANDESSWRAIMDYFSPAVQLGLTATPKRKINADTYSYFGEPVYTYSLKDGINDGFLTPFKVKQISTTIDDYVYTSDDEVLEGEIDEDRVYTEADINTIIEIKQREEYRVKLLLSQIGKSEKTIIFCANQNHALAVRDLINQFKKVSNPNYCHRVTANDGKLGEQFLRDFQDNEKSIPTILTTSHKLSTGVDAPEVKNIVLLRPINTMIEFKQIIGRGTRIFDGKDYFTIFDFVKAHLHFNDPEWDGEPLEPEPPTTPPGSDRCKICGMKPCICEKGGDTCIECGYFPCQCEKKPRQMIRVKLADGKVRQFQNMIHTSFWNAEGKPMSAEEFLKSLYGVIPELFKSEEELRRIWSKPDTRRRLLYELSNRGFNKSQLEEFQKLLNAEKSDLFDVLSYISYNTVILNREERVDIAKIHFIDYDDKQKEFLDFVLNQYIKSGEDELDDSKLGNLLELKYHSISDAKNILGDIQKIRNTFIEFQEYLYIDTKVG